MAEPVKPVIPTEPIPVLGRPKAVQPINKTKLHLTEYLRYIDEKQESWNMNEGDYLEVTEMLKEAFNICINC